MLSARRHGENSVVVQLLTRGQGRHAGLVRGGQGKRARGLYQPGNLVAAQWSARLAEHLGNYSCELVDAHAARVFDDPARLAALSAAAALAETALPEREPHAACFEGFLALLEALPGEHWAEVYVRWELALLAELGFGLDLASCAAGRASVRAASINRATWLRRSGARAWPSIWATTPASWSKPTPRGCSTTRRAWPP